MPKYQRRSVKLKKLILDMAEALGKVSDVCREWEVPRSTLYRWKTAYDKHGIEGLVPGKPIAKSHPHQLPPECSSSDKVDSSMLEFKGQFD